MKQRTAAQTPQRAETRPEKTINPQVAPAEVQLAVPKPPAGEQRIAVQTRRRVETRPEQVITPQAAPAEVQPAVP
ncbi:MAG: hypothetical protein OXP66_00195, partial [Candidatus Tectomicrobia bacterium]|nr:hypothetical protein [Candidatus Tectomicrobia bacterium]